MKSGVNLKSKIYEQVSIETLWSSCIRDLNDMTFVRFDGKRFAVEHSESPVLTLKQDVSHTHKCNRGVQSYLHSTDRDVGHVNGNFSTVSSNKRPSFNETAGQTIMQPLKTRHCLTLCNDSMPYSMDILYSL